MPVDSSCSGLRQILQESLKTDCSDLSVLNEEQDGVLLLQWKTSSGNVFGTLSGRSNLEVLYTAPSNENIVQASVNKTKTLLAYVIKERLGDTNNLNFKLNIVELKQSNKQCTLYAESSMYIKVQFLYKKLVPTEKDCVTEYLLQFIHTQSISLCTIKLRKPDYEWIQKSEQICKTIVRTFLWAQWNGARQQLHYVHYRELLPSMEEEDTHQMHAMLSCLQFHDNMPHETVLNIPLHMPELPLPVDSGVAEVDNIPFRMNSGLLNLSVLSDNNGLVCICHHYIYQSSGVMLPSDVQRCDTVYNSVFFAYSITLLHHSCVIHVVVPGVSSAVAKNAHISCALHGDHHLLVIASGLFVHLLDVGLSHEPCNHLLLQPAGIIPLDMTHLAPLDAHRPSNKGTTSFIDMEKLQFLDVHLSRDDIIRSVVGAFSLPNKLAALHYFLYHLGDLEGAKEVLTLVCKNPLNLEIPKVFEEFLVATAYSGARRNLPNDASQLLSLLPFTTVNASASHSEVKVGNQIVRLVQTSVGNVATMLLSPQQRLAPYHVDSWTRLWDHLQKIGQDRPRFRFSQVAEKLMVSLLCYQPEALSRASTPMSPSSPLICTGTMADITSILSRRGPDVLPFHEVESCTASKQEYVISVNLRELSMFLLKNSAKDSPMHVHAVATKYVGAQLEMSRLLCHLACTLAGVDPDKEQERGFRLINQLDEDARRLLFTLLERYYLAVEELAFSLPQGFPSFFAYLGYRVLPFPLFIQYIQKGVLDLHVDVVKLIMADIDETPEGTRHKLQLVSLLPRTRAKRILNQWAHPQSLMLRAREHALNILSGVGGRDAPGRGLSQRRLEGKGLAAFPSADRLSPLDTFLNLLTAKASLTELDLGLLIEATVCSTEENGTVNK